MVFTKKSVINGLVHLFLTPGQQNAIFDSSFGEKLVKFIFFLACCAVMAILDAHHSCLGRRLQVVSEWPLRR